jgi:hypothetical protein
MAPKNMDLVFQQALLLIAQANDKFFTLAKLLRQLHDEDYEWFKSLAKLPQLGKRKAYYLLHIEKVFGGLPIELSRLNQIGWTKLQVISKHVTESNYEAFLQLAETHTTENLKLIMQGKRPVIGGRSVLLQLTGKEFQAFAEAIVKNGAIANGDGFIGKEQALIKALNANKE